MWLKHIPHFPPCLLTYSCKNHLPQCTFTQNPLQENVFLSVCNLLTAVSHLNVLIITLTELELVSRNNGLFSVRCLRYIYNMYNTYERRLYVSS